MRTEESDEAHLICVFPILELLLRRGHLGVFSLMTSLDDATWRKSSASFALGASPMSTTHDTGTSVPLLRELFVLRSVHVVLDAVIQHCV